MVGVTPGVIVCMLGVGMTGKMLLGVQLVITRFTRAVLGLAIYRGHRQGPGCIRLCKVMMVMVMVMMMMMVVMMMMMMMIMMMMMMMMIMMMTTTTTTTIPA
jgi:hypothetical protein